MWRVKREACWRRSEKGRVDGGSGDGWREDVGASHRGDDAE
jgi:hypothetical protein